MADPTTMTTQTVTTALATPTSSAPTVEEILPQDDLIIVFNVVIWALVAVSGFFYFLRVYCKITRERGLWWDDHVMGAAWLTLVISSIFGSVSTTRGFGNHTWNIDTESHSFATLLLIMNLTGFWSIFGAAWSKTSFAITLLRISTGKARWLIWFIIATVNLTLTLAAIFMWVQCNPPAKTYDPWVEGECWDGNVIVFYNSFATAWSGLADIVLAIMPWWIIARNSMNMKERIGLLVCMSLGVFAGLTSFAKIVTLSAITNDDMIHTVPLNILGIGEAAVTIVAASIPVLRALLTTQNPSKVASSGLISSSTPKTATSQGWRDRDYEALDKDSEHYSAINLTALPEGHVASSRTPTLPHEDPWGRRF